MSFFLCNIQPYIYTHTHIPYIPPFLRKQVKCERHGWESSDFRADGSFLCIGRDYQVLNFNYIIGFQWNADLWEHGIPSGQLTYCNWKITMFNG